MKQFIEILLFSLRRHKERSTLATLLTLQFLFFSPLLLDVFRGKIDYREMEQEAMNREYRETTGGNMLSFNLKPFDYYWKENQKDLFLPSRRVSSLSQQITEKKRTAPLNYVGLYRTEKEVTAMVKHTVTGKSHFCKKGDVVENFKVIEIGRDVLVVSAPSGELVHLPKGSKEEVTY